MSRLISIASPDAASAPVTFDTPLAMLAECHRRVEDQCATLQRLRPHLATHGPDRAAAEAATAVLRYFDLAGPKHHADEEADLFPALLASMAGSDAVCLRELTDGLKADHRRFEQLWTGLRAALTEIAAGRPAALDATAVEAFCALYAQHIAREETELLPMAERLIDPAVLAEIGRAMRRRRGAPD
ncbi:hemerythrin domain-containing protein [Ideonella sp. B508-1]|uniref:hemerythrin domain-containing protein n=1 Tax=Ideonella sp. B508-1 TaxID=137716 RepID=UPI0006869499|nr:hemerythrin domain-containing protein [Ideonella sp. B508-1]